ncbi:divergent polysaccharide deacetylase family protein [Hirschia litorea]|uniref:Divergent polysaccharide deacetylase family protein n=1 Tax=Hirschia litorea TaxID=1199156 RepID=A0ABW2IMB4_9PROT
MSSTLKHNTSPLNTGLKHAALGLTSIGIVFGLSAAFVQLTGNEDAGSPQASVGLFAERAGPAPALKSRLDEPPLIHEVPSEHGTQTASHTEDDEPSLPVSYPAEGATAQAEIASTGDGSDIRITRLAPEVAPEPEAEKERIPLTRAPVSGLYENGAVGRLPKIADDGRRPAEVYARPHTPTGKPQIALIVGGLGIKRSLTMQAISDLPPEVTLSFVPYSADLQTWVNRARAAGHEVLLEMPMEPYDYPNVDTGPDTLLTTLSAEENERRLKVVLGQTTGYFGVINYQGARLATESRVLKPIMEELNRRGLALIYDGAANRSVFPSIAEEIDMNFAEADRIVDTVPSADAIDRNLLHLEALALQNNSALGVGFAFPVTVDQFKQWSETIDSDVYELVPASVAAGINTARPEGSGDDTGNE